MKITLSELRDMAIARLEGVPDGEPLDPLTVALIDLGVKASVTSLDGRAIDDAIRAATDAGASTAQLEETIALVSGLGVHSLMVTAPLLLRNARASGTMSVGPLDPERQALWDEKVGADPFWESFERELPGFLDALLRLAPATFRAFFDYCAVPWRSGTVRAITKELVSMATDASPSHRFVPGFRIHLANSIKLGAGRLAILRTLDIAAASPAHLGYR